MKKLLAILAATVAVALSFVSCNKNGLGPDGTLNGTTWVASQSYSESGITVSVSISLSFTKSDFTLTGTATGSYQGQTHTETMSTTGSYSVSGSTVTLTSKAPDTMGEKVSGTISGNKMTFIGKDFGLDGGNELVFTKK